VRWTRSKRTDKPKGGPGLASEHKPWSTGAVRILNQCTSFDSDNPEVFLQLGIAQRALGHLEAARLAWGQYLQLAPDGAVAATVREALAEMKSAEP
jgi:predicted TPR repeat methyltransferase